ncbi:hypothetical protein NDN08_006495 [Rhodosorus marinus]|uniref:C2H2-type domain-containing protein n=1 Tax=Rhodosorus marinus TaxID=101924 RepID=A0AAV8ULC7_9RHOD|nr:hypothetical protein NDN08_006495 [Rhodosorus marinus]
MSEHVPGQGVAPGRKGESITCMGCRVVVAAENQREHYQSDWHRVNLKRRVAGLGPISSGEFEVRVKELEEKSKQEANKKEKRDRKGYLCEYCSKRFSSEKALEQHERSKRHIDHVRAANGVEGEDGEMEGEETHDVVEERLEQAEMIPLTNCLFCNHSSDDVEANTKHMAKLHGCFIPYVESLLSVESLLTYLGEKVGVGYACVFCSRSFSAVFSAQKHMIDKNHSRMIDSEQDWYDEYGEFYAWEDEDALDDGEEWEEVVGEEREMILSKHEAGADGEAIGTSGPQDTATEDDTAVELVLNSGARVGHRSMLRYYKQAPRPDETRDSVQLTRIMGEYRMIGQGSVSNKQAALPSRKQLESKRRLDNHVSKRQYYIGKLKANTNIAIMNSGYRP